MKFNDLGKQWEAIRETCLPMVDELGFDGGYIGGNRVEDFEREFAAYVGTQHAVGVSNGTDALKLCLQTLGVGPRDNVIIPANTFIADLICVGHLPLEEKPTVTVIDHDENFCIDVIRLEEYLSNRRESFDKAVLIAVHMYGHACNMEAISKLQDEYDLLLIEDCSQSHGTRFKGRMTGTFGQMAAFSLYPGKNLGALGDAGIIATDYMIYRNRLKSLRNYGSREKYYYEEVGHNNRLDPIQCIFLSEKLKRLEEWNARKRKIAKRYDNEIDPDVAEIPRVSSSCEHSYHVYCLKVDDRKDFMLRLERAGIPTLVHYPVPIYDTQVWNQFSRTIKHSADITDLNCGRIVSLPIHPFLTDEEVTHIINTINET